MALAVLLIDWWLIRHHHATLSEVFGTALKHPTKRWPTIVVWAVLTLHLFGELLPPAARRIAGRYDPIGQIARMLERC